jgi:hypothetical protein
VAAIETLAHVTEDTTVASAAFDAIARQCEELMATRRGTHAAELRRSVARSGLRLRSPPSYQRDVEALRGYSAGIQSCRTMRVTCPECGYTISARYMYQRTVDVFAKVQPNVATIIYEGRP